MTDRAKVGTRALVFVPILLRIMAVSARELGMLLIAPGQLALPDVIDLTICIFEVVMRNMRAVPSPERMRALAA